jgi:predicted DNA-binding transcriptional regulator AlpA
LFQNTRYSPHNLHISTMNDQNKTPIWQITVGDFERIVENAVSDKVEEAVQLAFEERAKLDEDQTEDIIGVKIAAKLTGLSIPTVYSKVSRFEMPTMSRGRPLLFSRKELISWLENGRPSIIQ